MSATDMPRVCVTGASGFIASHIVQQLLAKGYHVNGTVRDASNPKKTEHLTALPGASEKLKLFSAELLGGTGAFAEAMAGCQTVMHTATSTQMGSKDGENELLKPGMAGLESVLEAVEKNKDTVKCLVLTSSMSAVAPKPEPAIKTEEHWSDAEEQKGRGGWYHATKTLQEKRLYEWAAEIKVPDLRIVAICPTAVLGPMLQPDVNMTNGWFLGLFKNGKGGDKAANDSMSFVDVRDCAAHHVLAMEKPEASGRYMSICGVPSPGQEGVWEALHWNEIFKLMKEVHSEMPDVPPCEGERVQPTRFNLSKMNSLLDNKDMRDAKTMFIDLVADAKARSAL